MATDLHELDSGVTEGRYSSKARRMSSSRMKVSRAEVSAKLLQGGSSRLVSVSVAEARGEFKNDKLSDGRFANGEMPAAVSVFGKLCFFSGEFNTGGEVVESRSCRSTEVRRESNGSVRSQLTSRIGPGSQLAREVGTGIPVGCTFTRASYSDMFAVLCGSSGTALASGALSQGCVDSKGGSESMGRWGGNGDGNAAGCAKRQSIL